MAEKGKILNRISAAEHFGVHPTTLGKWEREELQRAQESGRPSEFPERVYLSALRYGYYQTELDAYMEKRSERYRSQFQNNKPAQPQRHYGGAE